MYITNHMIHPALRKRGILLRRALPFFCKRTFYMCGRLMKFMKGKHTKELLCEEILIDRPAPIAGKRQFRICVYRSKDSASNVPGLLWIHGGGYAIGAPEQNEDYILNFIRESGCVVVSPDYCLSTTAPYPAALSDCYTALLWMKEHASDYGIRTDQLMVGGESAGGGLAAALAIYARKKNEVAISFQMPLYPMLDDRMQTRSSKENDAPVWNTKSNENAWKLYLGKLYGTDRVPPYAAPGRLTDYRGLPPAFTYIGSIDPFRDETVAYMEALKAAGIPAEYRVFDGCFYAFDVVGKGTDIASEASELLLHNFRYAVANYFAPQPEAGPEDR